MRKWLAGMVLAAVCMLSIGASSVNAQNPWGGGGRHCHPGIHGPYGVGYGVPNFGYGYSNYRPVVPGYGLPYGYNGTGYSQYRTFSSGNFSGGPVPFGYGYGGIPNGYGYGGVPNGYGGRGYFGVTTRNGMTFRIGF